MTATVWSTASISVSAGAKLDMPMSLEKPSRCTYSFSIVSGSGPIGFRLSLSTAADRPLLDLRESDAEGSVQIVGPAILLATLDNSAAVMSAVELRCRVCIEPQAELDAQSAFRARANLRTELGAQLAAAEQLAKTARARRTKVHEVEARINELRGALCHAEGELQTAVGSMHAIEDQQLEASRRLGQLQTALRKQLLSKELFEAK